MIPRNGHVSFVVSMIIFKTAKGIIFFFHFMSNLVVIFVTTIFDIIGLELCQENKIHKTSRGQHQENSSKPGLKAAVWSIHPHALLQHSPHVTPCLGFNRRCFPPITRPEIPTAHDWVQGLW